MQNYISKLLLLFRNEQILPNSPDLASATPGLSAAGSLTASARTSSKAGPNAAATTNNNAFNQKSLSLAQVECLVTHTHIHKHIHTQTYLICTLSQIDFSFGL